MLIRGDELLGPATLVEPTIATVPQALPTTAALSVFWPDLREAYLHSAFYQGRAT